MYLCDIDRAALSHWVEDLRSAEIDGRRRDTRRPADSRVQVPEDPPGAAARHGSSGLAAISGASSALFRDCPVFIAAGGLPLRYIAVKETFDRLLGSTGIVPAAKRRPRLHDLRHTFAVRALQGSPVDRSRSGAHMVALATCMGHVNIYATYWYLEATADLMRDVAAASEGFIVEGRQS